MPFSQPIRAQYLDWSGPMRVLYSNLLSRPESCSRPPPLRCWWSCSPPGWLSTSTSGTPGWRRSASWRGRPSCSSPARPPPRSRRPPSWPTTSASSGAGCRSWRRKAAALPAVRVVQSRSEILSVFSVWTSDRAQGTQSKGFYCLKLCLYGIISLKTTISRVSSGGLCLEYIILGSGL